MLVCKRFMALVVAAGSLTVIHARTGSDELMNMVLAACRSPSLFLDSTYTNRVACFRRESVDAESRSLADVAMAFSLLHEIREGELLSGGSSLAQCQNLTSNVFYSAEIGVDSWLRWIAGVQYLCALNLADLDQTGFVVTTNALSRLEAVSLAGNDHALWSAFCGYMCKTNISICEVYKLNAALSLAHAGRMSEAAQYTNNLSAAAMDLFVRDLK